MNLLILLVSFIYAHSSMLYPPSRGHPQNPNAAEQDSKCITTPFNGGPNCAPKNFPCHYPHDKKVVTELDAGQVFNVKFWNSATPATPGNEQNDQARHTGGQCQFSLSYDDDKTFTVIATYQKSCPDIFYDWPVKIPDNAPSCERCTFAWSWINASGNREFYMNCADVKINGVKGGELKGELITIANLPGYPELKPDGDGATPTNTKGSGPSQEDIQANTKKSVTTVSESVSNGEEGDAQEGDISEEVSGTPVEEEIDMDDEDYDSEESAGEKIEEEDDTDQVVGAFVDENNDDLDNAVGVPVEDEYNDDEGYDDEGYDDEGYDDEGYDDEGYDDEGYDDYYEHQDCKAEDQDQDDDYYLEKRHAGHYETQVETTPEPSTYENNTMKSMKSKSPKHTNRRLTKNRYRNGRKKSLKNWRYHARKSGNYAKCRARQSVWNGKYRAKKTLKKAHHRVYSQEKHRSSKNKKASKDVKHYKKKISKGEKRQVNKALKESEKKISKSRNHVKSGKVKFHGKAVQANETRSKKSNRAKHVKYQGHSENRFHSRSNIKSKKVHCKDKNECETVGKSKQKIEGKYKRPSQTQLQTDESEVQKEETSQVIQGDDVEEDDFEDGDEGNVGIQDEESPLQAQGKNIVEVQHKKKQVEYEKVEPKQGFRPVGED